MLNIENIDLFYGAIHALHSISFHVEQGEIVTLIGANGAGKTSVLNAISAIIPYKGEIQFKGSSITKTPAHLLVPMGIAHVPEGRRVFSAMSVRENLELGAYTRNDLKKIHQDMERVYAYFPRLKERHNQTAGTLSGGEQQMLAIGRALMSNPRLIMMDEPSMGLAPILVSEIFEIISEINQAGTTVLLVEQNAHMALSIANRGYVLETGRIVKEGTAKELLSNDDVRKAYLGTA